MRGQWKAPLGYLTIADVGKVLGWTWEQTWRWGTREKVFFKFSGHWVTTKRRIALSFPDVTHQHVQES